MTKKKNKHDLWKRLHFKYRVSATNENTLEEIWKLRVSIFWGAFLVILFAFLLVTLTSVFIIATPVRYYLPGYLDSEVRGEAVRAAIRIDSLEQHVRYQEAYLANLRDVFAGRVQIDSVKDIDTIAVSEKDPKLRQTAREAKYVKKYEEDEKYNLSVIPAGFDNPMDGVIFVKPLNGIVIEKYNLAKQKYGITLSASGKETVVAVLEGTVISAGFDARWEYMIQVQHKNGYVSMYKHTSLLLKTTGDKVRTGEALAIIDVDKDKLSKEYLLYFELWYKGNSVNPQDYITF